ncbi:MAG TPA: coenzyme F420-0:L-glutamate ligase [Candidatus Paceibacterota bacterium]|nr:coenzyme F420-0:L-glutamate ligase [Candidatus Paceibacterota bacterium]
MKVETVKTHKVKPGEDRDLYAVLDRYLPKLKEGSVVAITSKIVAICQGRYAKIGSVDKGQLIEKESEYFLPPGPNGFYLTVKYGILSASAGIDESNGGGYYILWPKDPQKTANEIRTYLAKKHGLKNVGVVICDSKITPLRWGVTGVSITHSGFAAMNDYIGTPDIFGRELKFTKTNIMDGLGGVAVMLMGEGKEQTPLAIIEDVPFVNFQQRNPTQKEIKEVCIGMMQDDLYCAILTGVKWRKGGSGI